jgi:glutathione S-transferase
MPTLYHLQHSPFSRRARLALAHKGVPFDAREVSADPKLREEALRLVAFKTLPVFVDGDRALGDSAAISRWLDAAHPNAPRLWPHDGEGVLVATQTAALVDVVLDSIANVGTRYYALREAPAWSNVKGEIIGRAQRALDALAARVAQTPTPTILASGWSAADIWLFTAIAWLEGLPHRVGTSQNAAQIVAVGGWHVPDPLAPWAETHRTRPEIRALG